MARVLLLDAYTEAPFASPHFLRWLGGAEVVVVRPAIQPLPPLDTVDAVVITGSHSSVCDGAPWIERVRALTRRAVEEDRAVLGVCWGHQVLASALGAPVFRRTLPEVGFPQVARSETSDPVLGALPDRFPAFVSHEDEVRPTQELTWLARTGDCPTHALRVPGRAAWGVQFHVEYDAPETEAILKMRAERHPELEIDVEAQMTACPELGPFAQALFGAFLREVDRC